MRFKLNLAIVNLNKRFLANLAICFLTIQFFGFEPKAALGKEFAMYCVFKEPTYKFVDRLFLPDRVFKKTDGKWKSFCNGKNQKLNVLDRSAECILNTPIFVAKRVNLISDAISETGYKAKCQSNKLTKNLIDTTQTHSYVWNLWDTELNICEYYNLMNYKNNFKYKEPMWNHFYHNGEQWRSSNPKFWEEKKEFERLKEKLKSMQFFVIEETDFNYQNTSLYDFQLETLRYRKLKPHLSLPSGVTMVQPSDGAGQRIIRDIHGYPWEIINFNESQTFDCEKVNLN